MLLARVYTWTPNSSFLGRQTPNASPAKVGLGGVGARSSNDDTIRRHVATCLDRCSTAVPERRRWRAGRRRPGRAAGASAYVPVSPYRILDTRIGPASRNGSPPASPSRRRCPDVPAGSRAVVLNLTVDGPADAGFVTVYPDGDRRGPWRRRSTSTLPGSTIANLVTVPIGTGGAVDIYSLMSTDLVADVQGYYSRAASPGRAVHPARPDALARHPGADLEPLRRARCRRADRPGRRRDSPGCHPMPPPRR